MAMYEKDGFCPSNSFLYYQLEEKNYVHAIWNRTHEILGDRIGYMVYTEAGCSYYDWCYVVDCLIGSTSTLGVDLACRLEEMIPNCKYAEIGRKILVTDIINPFQIPGIGHGYVNSVEKFVGSEKLYVLEDKRYVVGITDEGEAVHLYFFRKV